HSHADHFSASHLFAPAEIAMSEHTRSERPGRRLRDGETIQVGTLSFKVIHTPGHTPDSICLYGEGVLFTGDTLLIGTTGRTDFEGSSPEELWDSLQKLKDLPDDVLV